MKTLKSIITTGILAGNLVFSNLESSGQDTYIFQKEIEAKSTHVYNPNIKKIENDSVINYNGENKQTYKDFVDFVKEKGFCLETEKYHLDVYRNTIEDNVGSFLSFDIYLYKSLGVGKKLNFYDHFANGFWNSLDGINDGEFKKITDLNEEEQLSIAKEYTNTLKEIMHEGKFKDY